MIAALLYLPVAHGQAAPKPNEPLVRLLTPVEAAEPTAGRIEPLPEPTPAGRPVLPPLPAPPVALPPAPEQRLDLAEALRRAGVANPTIALAQEAVRASRAEQLRAQAMLLPTLHAGADFNLHRGVLETSRGIIEDVNRQSVYAGAGAAAVGAGTVTVPGVWVSSQLAEAWFEPKAARAAVAARSFDAVAVRNNVLLEVTTRYLVLAGAAADLRALRESERELAELARVTARFYEEGQGRKSDAERVRSELLLLQNQAARVQEAVATAAADLARLLEADPAVRLLPGDEPVPLVALVDPQLDAEKLLQIALANRPELAARAADMAVQATRLREEEVRPLVPLLTAGFSAGEFGGGSDLADSSFGHTRGRVDFDLMAVWSLQGLGLGNLAVQRERRAQVLEAAAVWRRVSDQVRREVVEAMALSTARRRQLDAAERAMVQAREAYRLDLLRTRNLVQRALPVEVLNSLRLLTTARQEQVHALIAYDQAQFQLFVALGQPPTLALPDVRTCP
jgi:outer membrane protein TolC